MILRDAITQFTRFSGLKEKTLTGFRPMFVEFSTLVTPTIKLSGITINHINSYRSWLITNGKNKAIIRGRMLKLRSFFRHFRQFTDLPVLDHARIPLERCYIGSYGSFTIKDIERLRKVLKSRKDKMIFEVMYSTGLREAEMRSILIKNIDLVNGTIQIVGKGDKPATVFITNRANRTVRHYLTICNKECPYLLSFRGKNFVYKRFKRWGVRAGIKCHPHMLRKAFAQRLYDATGDIYATSKLLRHENVDTTQRYAIVDREKMQRVHSMGLGKNSFFTYEEKRDGSVLIRAEVFCAEGINPQSAKEAMKGAMEKLLSS